MSDITQAPAPEELGYFYDTIHGRVALEDLPERFRPALKAALSSKSLARLKRISQLGHTSVNFFSATHTRFSHAMGTMVVMNKLFRHVCDGGLSNAIFAEVEQHYGSAVARFKDARDMVHCHLLLAAMYQDVGELPFQKVTSLYFVPFTVTSLENDLPRSSPKRWTGKKVFSVLSLSEDMKDDRAGFAKYDLEFLAFLITGDGAPAGTEAIGALLQMMDGALDADRLDYVYRDSWATIGSLCRPSTVLQSVVRYETDKVIVNDPQPVTDFFSTRMRLWTFVYNSADVRFRQVLLKTVLDGRWHDRQSEAAFRAARLEPGLTLTEFRALDDNSLMERIENIDDKCLEEGYRLNAKRLLIRGTLDYECRALKRNALPVPDATHQDLPDGLFFDLLLDLGHHQLYRQGSVFIRQRLTSTIDHLVPLEQSAGALSPLFVGTNSAVLVNDAYYLFLPRDREGGRWPHTKTAIENGTMFSLVSWEHARRDIACPTDTRSQSEFPAFSNTRAISISYCSADFRVVVRIVRELHKRNHRYRLFLRPFDGTGGTPGSNSSVLVSEADAILVLASVEYLRRALDGNTYINIEVTSMHGRAKDIPIVPLGVDGRDELRTVEKWNWGQMNEAWRSEMPVMSEQLPLRDATEQTISAAIDYAIKAIERGGRP